MARRALDMTRDELVHELEISGLRGRGGAGFSMGKKASFLQTIIGQFGLPARVVARRIDDSYPLVSKPEIVTARALAALPALLDLSAPWLTDEARALFHKGRDYRAEVEESTHRWGFDLVEHPSMTDASGVILEVSDLHPATRNEFLA